MLKRGLKVWFDNLFGRVKAAYYAGNSIKSLTYIDTMLVEYPNVYILWLLKATIYDEMKRYEKNFNSWNILGIIYGKLGRYERSLEALNKALEIEPNNTGACINKATTLAYSFRIDEAIEFAGTFLKKNPDNKEVIDMINRLKRAKEDFTKNPKYQSLLK